MIQPRQLRRQAALDPPPRQVPETQACSQATPHAARPHASCQAAANMPRSGLRKVLRHVFPLSALVHTMSSASAHLRRLKSTASRMGSQLADAACRIAGDSAPPLAGVAGEIPALEAPRLQLSPICEALLEIPQGCGCKCTLQLNPCTLANQLADVRLHILHPVQSLRCTTWPWAGTGDGQERCAVLTAAVTHRPVTEQVRLPLQLTLQECSVRPAGSLWAS